MRPRRLLPLTVAVVGAAVASWNALSFVATSGASQPLLRAQDSEFAERGSAVAMRGGARRQGKYNFPKKNHIRNNDKQVQRGAWNVPWVFAQMTYKKEPNLEYWSQTLKLTFPEGEDDKVTEEQVMSYFTTDAYKPDAVIVGHKLPHEEIKHAYVHFGSNDAAVAARKEKDGGAIGDASQVKVVYTDEKKWIRLRDGVSLQGGPRASWMKAYGWKTQPGYANGWVPETGTLNHPVYPE